MNLLSGSGRLSVGPVAPGIFDNLSTGRVTSTELGILVVYVDNQTIGKDVWFDNVQVLQYNTQVLEENHYYPFGLTVSTSAMGITEQPLKFTSQELQSDFGLNFYNFKYRQMDMQLGRFVQIDPVADMYPHNSTYAYAENRVINGIDMEGLEWSSSIDGKGVEHLNVNVNFSVDAALNLSSQQVQAYQDAINNQFRNSLELSSGGAITGAVTFNGGDEVTLGQVVPSISLYGKATEPGANFGFAGNTMFEKVSLNVYNNDGSLKSPNVVGEDGAHELPHTLRTAHPFEITQSPDTRLIKTGVNEYSSTPTTNVNIKYNIMNYSMIKIDGVKLGDLWKLKPGNLLTPGQLQHMQNEIKLQTNGAGTNKDPNYFDYWINTPGIDVQGN